MRRETRHRHSVSWASVGIGTAYLRPEMKKRFPSNFKAHYNDVVGVAEKLSRRLLSRSHRSYDVEKEQRKIHRTGQDTPSNSLVTVHNLRQLDGGILDPDDRLHDVADDREQIIAIYDEATKPQQGDGTSASDDSENPSPNIFKNVDHKFEPFSRNGIEITGEELHSTPPPLHVRRGSEPALNRLSPIPPYPTLPLDPNKRWSAAPVIEDQSPPSSTPLKNQDCSPAYEEVGFEEYPGERGEGSGEEKIPSSLSASSSASSHHSATTTTLSRFTRDGNRCSVQILSDNPNMGRWAEAADRAIETTNYTHRSEGLRRDPVGGASTPRHSREHSLEGTTKFSFLVSLINDGSPLGIHVIPSTDKSGLEQGLLVEGIELDGRVARDGGIRVHDTIVEINSKSLRSVSFHQAQEIFKDAMKDPELKLLIVRQEPRNSSHHKMVYVQERSVGGVSKVANVSQNRRTPSITLSSRTQAVMLHSNTRKIGKRLTVNLIKGPHGLGFSITTRDNPAGGEAPIYIKNILPKGAAIEEGTLSIGDRLLEVNGVQVTGYSQSEVAGLLRQISIGGVASLVVSRQEKGNEGYPGIGVEPEDQTGNQPASPKLPRQLPSERVAEDSLMLPWKQREILTFEIPVHDSERAGLGVSVKGKTSSGPHGCVDLGIFVKNVIHGGAASRDGRLRQNDQLVNINGLSLLGKSNSEAMKTLRTAMHQEYRLRLLSQQSSANQLGIQHTQKDLEQDLNNPLSLQANFDQVQQFVGPTPGKITLTVARRVDGGQRDFKGLCSLSNPEHSGSSEASANTVIFNVKKDNELERGIEGCLDFGTSDFQMSNPVIQRLTGNGSAALRNESYYKATHDTWNASHLHQITSPAEEKERLSTRAAFNQFGSPTVNLPSCDTVLIHDEYEARGGARSGCASVIPVGSSVGVYSDQPSQSSDAYVSQTSLEEPAVGFSRDQFGRQSMSEKRHATLDAKSTDTYQRNKKAREEREKYKQDIYSEMGPDCGTSSQSPQKVRELPIDVPPNIELPPSSTLATPLSLKAKQSKESTKEKSTSFSLLSPCKTKVSNKNETLSPKLERLKGLAMVTDLVSYTGKSLTLQPSFIERPNATAKTLQLRSLRSPTKFSSIQQAFKIRRISEGNWRRSSLGATTWIEEKSPTKDISNMAYQDKESKKGPRASFGQELSAIIHSWARRNRELLHQNVAAKAQLPRVNSDEFLTPFCGYKGQSRTLQDNLPLGNSPGTPCSPLHLRNTATFQRMARGPNRGNKEVGPGLGMRKSSSLESLQTMVQEMALEDEGQRAGSGRVPRGRGCNESFRAAVDRSYEAPLTTPNNQMETLAEEESESSGSGFGRGNSCQSSVNSSNEDKLKKGGKKRPGIFKGLGSMFRFGKHRKNLDSVAQNLPEEEQMEIGDTDSRRQFEDVNENSKETYMKLMENAEPSLCNAAGIPLSDDENQSRSERMHQLRAQHQRRHAQRNGTYPTDDLEERYDHVLKQRMDSMPPEPKVEIQHLRSRSYDLYGDGKRARRATAFSDPNKFSHYVNYEQIQMHMRKNQEQERLAKLASQQYQDFRDKQTSREQREYQSQRCARETYQQRPVSNYYEYESVQAVMNHAQGGQYSLASSSLPRRPQQPPHQLRGAQQQASKLQVENSSHPPPVSNHPINTQNKNSNPSQTKSHPQGGRLVHTQPLFSRSRGQPPPLTQSTKEGVYAASGFRPASQYNTVTHYHKSLNHNHASMTVPGSKV